MASWSVRQNGLGFAPRKTPTIGSWAAGPGNGPGQRSSQRLEHCSGGVERLGDKLRLDSDSDINSDSDSDSDTMTMKRQRQRQRRRQRPRNNFEAITGTEIVTAKPESQRKKGGDRDRGKGSPPQRDHVPA